MATECNFVLNCFRLVNFVKKIFIRLVMSWMTSLKVWMLATGKILN